jgi:hypothetical protein
LTTSSSPTMRFGETRPPPANRRNLDLKPRPKDGSRLGPRTAESPAAVLLGGRARLRAGPLQRNRRGTGRAQFVSWCRMPFLSAQPCGPQEDLSVAQ